MLNMDTEDGPDVAVLLNAQAGSGHTPPDADAVRAAFARHGQRATVFACFVRKERGVDAAIHDGRPPLSCKQAHLVSPAGVAGVDTDPDDVSTRDALRIKRFECFVND